MRSFCAWAAACAACFFTLHAWASPILLGATATAAAVASGPTSSLLGADNGYSPGTGSNVTVVTDSLLDPAP